MEAFLEMEFETIQVLAVAPLAALAVRYVRLPYAVALVVAGLVLAVRGSLHPELAPRLAPALSLPAAVGNRPQLLAMTFAVFLFAILVQAVSISGLPARLGLTRRSQQPDDYHRVIGKLLAIGSASRCLDRLHREDALLPTAYATVKEELAAREQRSSAQMEDLPAEHPGYHEQITTLARAEALRAERSALENLTRNGLLNEESLIELQAELDQAIENAEDSLVT